MAKKMALGKGIASLLQETPNQILRSTLASEATDKETGGGVEGEVGTGSLSVKISNIRTNPDQPRKIFELLKDRFFSLKSVWK